MTGQKNELGPLQYTARQFGSSQQSRALEIFEPDSSSPTILIMGSIHGDESLSTVLLSEALRSTSQDKLKAAVILAANPDGVLVGTRCNARGVDLNRNYPTANWVDTPVYYRNRPDDPQNIALSPGSCGGSEQETQAIMALVKQLKPRLIVSIHGFLACIDDPDETPVARDLALRTQMDLVPDVGYDTPGSFGSWCKEQHIPIITYELPSQDIVMMKKIHLPVLKDLVTGHYDPMIESFV